MPFTAATLDRFPDELELDLRTTDEIETDADHLAAAAYSLVTGYEARP